MIKEMYEDTVVQLCSGYAAIAHMKQLRKDKKTPYIPHPGRVSCFTATIGKLDFIGVSAAWLHDTPEDCAVGKHGDKNYPFIIQNHTDRYKNMKLFLLDNPNIDMEDGQKIFDLTMELCMSQDRSVPKNDRKVQYIKDIENGSVEASIIKYCDRIDNLTTCHIFSQGGMRYYIEDTKMILNRLGPKVKAVNSLLHLYLERKLDEVKKTYKKMYDKK
jgi:(p)ppGpp synthase/HD superfamily hydrolase